MVQRKLSSSHDPVSGVTGDQQLDSHASAQTPSTGVLSPLQRSMAQTIASLAELYASAPPTTPPPPPPPTTPDESVTSSGGVSLARADGAMSSTPVSEARTAEPSKPHGNHGGETKGREPSPTPKRAARVQGGQKDASLGAQPDSQIEQLMQSGDALRVLAEFLGPALRDDPSLMALARYYNAPCGFATNVLGVDLAPYQREILEHIVTNRRVSVRSPHGPGKTTTAAVAIIWFSVTRDLAGVDWKVVTTAGGWRQLTQYLWPEVHKWLRKMKWESVGRTAPNTRFELMDLSLKLRFGKAFGVASDNPELIEGAHADQLLYVLDEAKSISDETFDAVEGAFSGAGEAYALMLSTPGKPIGRFYQVQSHKAGYEDWWSKHITLREAVAAGRIRQTYADARKRQWGEDSAIYQNRVLGNFAATEEDGLIPLAWIEAANDRWLDLFGASSGSESDMREGDTVVGSEPAPPPSSVLDELLTQPVKIEYKLTAIGVDVAARGEDKTVVAMRYGPHIKELRKFTKQDTMQTADRVYGILRAPDHIGVFATIDVNGLGVGVYDRLRQQGANVLPYGGAERTRRVDKTGELGFANVRSAAYWYLRELLDPSSGAEAALPPDDDLAGDLTTPKWDVVQGGKIAVQRKEDVVSTLGRSPDAGDAVVMAYWNSTANAQVASIVSKASRWTSSPVAYVAQDGDGEDQPRQVVVGSRWKRPWNH